MTLPATRETLNMIDGAALDVIEDGPNGRDDPRWHTPHLLLTPHMASFTPGRQARVERFVEEQVARFVRGEPLWYQVDWGRLEAEAMNSGRGDKD